MVKKENLDRIDKALKVLDSDLSAYSIGLEVGLQRSTITRYRNHQYDPKNLKLGSIIKLSEMYEKKFK